MRPGSGPIWALQDAHATRACRPGAVLHIGLAATIEDVIGHYEVHLGFVFTDAERAASRRF